MFDGAYFTTESYPTHQRVSAWRETLRNFSLTLKDNAFDRSFFASITSKVSPRGILFGLVSSGAQELTYWEPPANGDVCLVLHLQGAGEVIERSLRTPLMAGHVLYGPVGIAAKIALHSDFRQLLVKIPRQTLRSRLAAPFPMKLGQIAERVGIGRVFGQMLESIAETLSDLTAAQLWPVEIALAEFLVNCVGIEESKSGMAGVTGTQNALLHRISQLIESRLGEADLSVAQIAQDTGISVRYVHKLFESAGENFGHYVRTRRLERCRSDLTNPLYAHLSISDICYRWVFNDSAHFSRAFRDEYGTSPRMYRRESGDPIAKNMLQHMSRGWPDISHDTYKKLVRGEDEPARNVSIVPSHANIGAAPAARHHLLPINDDNVHWGYFSRSLQPRLEIESGDFVTIETLSHHCGDDYERMVKGDPAAESIFHWDARGKTIERRGAGPMAANVYGRGSGEGIGVHICTGPVAVKGAEPGDVIEVRILDIAPRPSTNPQYVGSAFGSNAATWWGFQYKELVTEPRLREVITIYKLNSKDSPPYAHALYNYRWTPQTDPFGTVHDTIDYPGMVVDHKSIKKNYGILKNIRVPVRPHFGLLALAPKEFGLVDSIPPSYFGGNIDDKRATAGATIYLPVSVAGGLFSVGDPHASQGDGEVCGTAIECSLTGKFQFVLHKKQDMAGKPFADLNYPLLETQTEWVVHGFSRSNYLVEFGDTAQSEIYKNSSLDPAMKDAFRKMRRFLMTSKGLTEDEAISLMSVAVDFGITQVINGNWCVHGILQKGLFVGGETR